MKKIVKSIWNTYKAYVASAIVYLMALIVVCIIWITFNIESKEFFVSDSFLTPFLMGPLVAIVGLGFIYSVISVLIKYYLQDKKTRKQTRKNTNI